jgi:predicted negative regulator of RcsB-dependent stress response
MKTAERRHLRDNEIAEGLARAGDAWARNSRTISQALIVLAVIAAGVLGYWWWRSSQLERASALLAEARTTALAPIAPPAPVAEPGQPVPPPPPPNPDAFPNEAARRDAALKKFQTAAAAYPTLVPGLEAHLQAASLLSEMGRVAEAETHLDAVVQADGDGFYGRLAKLGIATIQIDAGKPEPAIATLQELSQRTDLAIPIDGVLMQLGRAYEKAGKRAEAIAAFTRIGDEFPESPYAGDAKTEVDRLKGAAAGA